MVNEVTAAVEVTDSQRQIILGALTDKLLDVNRYLQGSKEPESPRPEDACRSTHLARYEMRRKNYLALKRQKKHVDALIDLFTRVSFPVRSAEQPIDPEGSLR